MRILTDKTAVITGAGGGMGRALALTLAKEGVRLALADQNPKALKETLSLLKGVKVKTWTLDVTNRQAVDKFAAQVKRAFGPVDILINNAGVNSWGQVADTKMQTLEWMINVNMWGTIYMTKAFLPQLLSRKESSLVNISSALGLMGFYGQAGYSASKFAVRGFSEGLQHELAGTPISVTVVYPGGVRTGIHQRSRNEYSLSSKAKETGRKEMEAGLKSTPQQAAEAIVKGIRSKKTKVLVGRDAVVIDLVSRFLPGLSGLYMNLAKKKDPFWKRVQK
ncbi:MAG TPA: SDR family NAD(P)-dependent oxidoreductase [bacterium]|nr:SDR family NAD(P)-dependent oxidoreductase [bacterium]